VPLLLWLLLVGVVLAGFLYVGALFLQRYFYTEPAEQLPWGAPVAAGVLTLFLGLWCLLDLNNPGVTPRDLPYDSLFRFSPRETMSKDAVMYLWAVRTGSKDPVEFKLHKITSAGFAKSEYREKARPEKKWSSSHVDAILIEVNGQKCRFDLRPSKENPYREFVDENGWVLREYDNGPDGQPTRFRFGLLLANLFLNFLHLGLWFACLWALLRFQWSHALGLALILWLVATPAILEPLLDQAGKLAHEQAQAHKSAALVLPPLFYLSLIDKPL
jgi:hypothetical protein